MQQGISASLCGPLSLSALLSELNLEKLIGLFREASLTNAEDRRGTQS